MSQPFNARVAEWDQVLLGGHLLAAVEAGRIRMDAEGYLDIASWMEAILERSDVETVLHLGRTGPSQVRTLAENVLSDRGVKQWAFDRLGGSKARTECAELLQRVGRAAGR